MLVVNRGGCGDRLAGGSRRGGRAGPRAVDLPAPQVREPRERCEGAQERVAGDAARVALPRALTRDASPRTRQSLGHNLP